MSFAANLHSAIFKKRLLLESAPDATVDAADTQEGATVNPCLNARRTWNARTASVVSSGQMWRIVGNLQKRCT